MGYFIQALIERKVFQAVAMYAAVMWLLLQVVDVAEDPLSLPLWVSRALILATFIGIPIVATVSWVYDFSKTRFIKTTPENRPEVNAQAFVALALIVFVVIGVSVVISRRWDAETEVASAEIVTLAVLPFKLGELATQSHLQFLADDIKESLLRVSGIRMLPEDVLEGVDTRQSASTLGEQLGVRYILSGEIQSAEDEITITVGVTDTQTGTSIFEERFLGAELAAVNQLVANAVFNQFDIEKAATPELTNNARAYDLYLRGQQEFALDSVSAAGLEYTESAIEADNRFALPLTALCDYYLTLYSQERDPDYFAEAERSCYRSLTLLPEAPEAHYSLGQLYRRSGQAERAIEEFRQVLAANPEHHDAQIALARTLGDDASGYDEAERLLLSLIQRNPGSPGVYASLQNLYFSQGRYQEALQPAAMAARLRPENEGYQYSYSGLLLLAGQFSEAREYLLQVLQSGPSSRRSGFEDNLATAYFFEGDFAAAAQLYRASWNAVPNDDRVLANLGDALWHAEGPDSAREIFQQVVELARQNLAINPNAVDHLQSLIIAAGSLGDRDLLEQSLTAALEVAPQNPQNYYRSAVAYQRLGDSDRALRNASIAIEMGYPRTLIEFDADLKGLY